MDESSQPGAASPAGAAPGQAPPANYDTWPWVDRRSGQDRRQRPTRWYDSLLGHRRRRRGRRRGESRNIYVDVYHARDLILLLVIFVLNLLDAGLTLAHVASGGVEQNPLMDSLLGHGATVFVLEKIVVVGACVVALVVHKHFRLARLGAWIVLIFYSVLMIKHLSLFF